MQPEDLSPIDRELAQKQMLLIWSSRRWPRGNRRRADVLARCLCVMPIRISDGRGKPPRCQTCGRILERLRSVA